MKVICRQRCPSKEQNVILGYDERNAVGFELTVGLEYTVLGINFHSVSPINKGVIFLLRDDIGRCAFVPMCLLDISNAHPSKFWIAEKSNESNLLLWPEEFFSEYFHDDLSDGVPAVVETFERVCQLLDNELA